MSKKINAPAGQHFPLEKLPEGCKHLYGNLFMVPFQAIRTPDIQENVDADGEYRFGNPRLLVERGQADLLDKKLSSELRDSIKNHTLLNPLVCRWVNDGDKAYPMILGGDRRYRALDYLIRRKEEVVDPRVVFMDQNERWAYHRVPADEAYEFVVCQVFACNDDLEALALAWAENKGRINLTEGHEIAEVIKLREVKASDGKILEILQRDQKWLAEVDRLVAGLDHKTLADLMEGRLDKSSAMELLKIEDADVRDQVRQTAVEQAQETFQKKFQRIKGKLEKTLVAEELAEGAVAMAEGENEKQEAEEELAKVRADKKSLSKKMDQTRPVATTKDVRAAASEVSGEERASKRKILQQNQIKAGAEYLSSLIRNNGSCLDGSFTAHIDALRLALKLLTENILQNNTDWQATLKDHYGH